MKDFLICICLIAAFSFGVIKTGTQIQKYESEKIEREIKEYEKACKVVEFQIKQKQLQNEKTKQDLETIRLQAFIKAYSQGEYIIERFNREVK